MTDLKNYIPRQRPGMCPLVGASIALEVLDWKKHGQGLADALLGAANNHLWQFIPFGPFKDLPQLQEGFDARRRAENWETMVLLRRDDDVVMGTASWMRIREVHGSAEVGCVLFSENLKRTRMATEAMYLMASHVFDDLGYRRYEWKCDDQNIPSRKAALRLGFLYEGTFRNDLVVKGRNRDTAWFAMTDNDWPKIRAAIQEWLQDSNFTKNGDQRESLAQLRGV